jgi:hypothetical protein
VVSITNYSLRKIEKEWRGLKLTLQANRDSDLVGKCQCELILRFGLPYKHHLRRAYLEGIPILKSLVHPRWWLDGPATRQANWQPRYTDEEPVVYHQPELVEIDNLGRDL